MTNGNFRCRAAPILLAERTLEHACDISTEKIKLGECLWGTEACSSGSWFVFVRQRLLITRGGLLLRVWEVCLNIVMFLPDHGRMWSTIRVASPSHHAHAHRCSDSFKVCPALSSSSDRKTRTRLVRNHPVLSARRISATKQPFLVFLGTLLWILQGELCLANSVSIVRKPRGAFDLNALVIVPLLRPCLVHARESCFPKRPSSDFTKWIKTAGEIES